MRWCAPRPWPAELPVRRLGLGRRDSTILSSCVLPAEPVPAIPAESQSRGQQIADSDYWSVIEFAAHSAFEMAVAACLGERLDRVPDCLGISVFCGQDYFLHSIKIAVCRVSDIVVL